MTVLIRLDCRLFPDPSAPKQILTLSGRPNAGGGRGHAATSCRQSWFTVTVPPECPESH